MSTAMSKLRVFAKKYRESIGSTAKASRAGDAKVASNGKTANNGKTARGGGGGGGGEPEPEFKPPVEARQPTLRLGDQNADGWVEYLQKALNALLDPSPSLKLDGNFDQATYKAVFAFQKQEGLVVDGVVGNQTWAALRFENPKMASTDGRPAHTYIEKGVEARWATEGVAFYTRSSDTLKKQVVSVGDETKIEGRKANVFVTAPGSKRKGVVVAIGPPDPHSSKTETGQGNVHLVVLRDFTKTFPSTPPGARVEDYLVEAYLEKELGGDFWTSKKYGIKVDSPAPGGGGGGKGGGGPTPQTGTATLEVHVHEEDGKPVQGATVRLSTGPTPKPDTQTNAGGIARFEGLADGKYHVNAAKRNIVWQPAYIAQGKLAPGQTFTVTLSKLAKPVAGVGNLGVTVSLDGNPLEGAKVTVTPVSGGQPYAGQTNGSGSAVFAGIPAGDYRVSAVDPASGKSGNISAHVEANTSQGVDISLSSGGSPPVEFSAGVTVVVTGEGVPLKGATGLAFDTEPPNNAFSGTTNSSGMASFTVKLGTKNQRSYNIQANPPPGTKFLPAHWDGNPLVVAIGTHPTVHVNLNRAPDWHDKEP